MDSGKWIAFNAIRQPRRGKPILGFVATHSRLRGSTVQPPTGQLLLGQFFLQEI